MTKIIVVVVVVVVVVVFVLSLVTEHRWNEIGGGKTEILGKTYPSATLSTTNPTWSDLGSNPGLLPGRPAANRLSHGTTLNHKLH
jgi:hypothetical protein